MTPFEAFYRRGCRSPKGKFEAGDVEPFGVDLVKDAQDKVRGIQAKRLATQSRQKKYANHKVRDLAFQTDENVLQVSPMKGVIRFGKKGKLSLYMLALPLNLLRVHPVFHVSMLKSMVTEIISLNGTLLC